MIAATIKGCHQVGPDTWQDHAETFLFSESSTIEEILAATKQTDISACNLSTARPVETKGEEVS